MHESIYIHQVGPLREVRIDDIKTVTLLIGESASGKSTLLKVLSLMRYLYKMCNIRAYLKYANISRSPFRLRLSSMLNGELKEMITAQSCIDYRVRTDEREYAVVIEKGKLSFKPQVDSRDLVFFKEAFISEKRNIIPQWKNKGAEVRGKELDFYLQETYRDFDAATDAHIEEELGYVGFKMKVKRGSKDKELLISPLEGDGAIVPLRYASSGIQTSASLLTNVRYFAQRFSFEEAFHRSVLSYLLNNSGELSKFSPKVDLKTLRKVVHIHIEEPELNLYPNAQRLLLNDIVREVVHPKAPDRQLGVMIATHSPYLLNQINVLIEASYHTESTIHPPLPPEQVAVYWLQDGELHSLMATDEETGHKVVDTYYLSEAMAAISDDYFALRGGQND